MANIILSYWYQLYTKQTPAERALEKEVAKLGIRYRTQHILISTRSILDFYFPDYNLVVEVDDKSHLTKKGIKKDQERTNRLTGLGLKVIRYTNEEVLKDPRFVAKNIQNIVSTLSPVEEINSAALGMSTKKTKIQKKRLPRKVPQKVSSAELMSLYQFSSASTN